MRLWFRFYLLTAAGETATFVAGEIREPKKNLPRGLLIGVSGVVFLYLAVNFVCLSVLGTAGLAETTTPASDVMRLALGDAGRERLRRASLFQLLVS